MSPILLRFTLGEQAYALRAYSTFYTLAWIVAPLLAAWFAGRRGLPWRRVLGVYALALAAGIAGARALDLFVAWRYYAEDPSRIWATGFAGYSLYGGLVVATVVGIALARVWRLPVWRLADSAVPGLVAGQVLMRTGCFLNGCCYGLPTDLPWGVVYPTGSPVWQAQFTSGTGGLLAAFAGVVHPVHPTQLYEVAGAIAFGALALVVMQRRRADGAGEARRAPADGTLAIRYARAHGAGFLVYALGFTLVRLGNHFLRARQAVVTAPEWFYPVFYLTLAAVIAGLLVWRVRRGGVAPADTTSAGSAGTNAPSADASGVIAEKGE
mgnify:FL=1